MYEDYMNDYTNRWKKYHRKQQRIKAMKEGFIFFVIIFTLIVGLVTC